MLLAKRREGRTIDISFVKILRVDYGRRMIATVLFIKFVSVSSVV
jgi:hypothetical protein